MKPAKQPLDPSRLPPDRFYGSEETAAYFGYSLRHFRDLVRAGKLPQPVRLNGRKWAWRESLLREFAEAIETEQGVRPPSAAA
jgi:predicted DNA-binding transcriptional regulator AlpA